MKRTLISLSAAALVGTVLPLARARQQSARARQPAAFSGYSSTAWAAPVKVEIYEPTIPIPVDAPAGVRARLLQGRGRLGQLLGRASSAVAGRLARRGRQDRHREPRPPRAAVRAARRPGLPHPGQLLPALRRGRAVRRAVPPAPSCAPARRRTTIAQVGFSLDGQVEDGSDKGGSGGGGCARCAGPARHAGDPRAAGRPRVPGWRRAARAVRPGDHRRRRRDHRPG